MAVGKIAKIITVSTAVGAISIAGIAYNSNKEAILEQINQLKKKATDWQKQAGDNKYELQQQQEKYASIIKTLKDKLGLELGDNPTVEEIASALESYVGDANSKTDVDTYNTAISSIATALGLELTDADKDDNGKSICKAIPRAYAGQETHVCTRIRFVGTVGHGADAAHADAQRYGCGARHSAASRRRTADAEGDGSRRAARPHHRHVDGRHVYRDAHRIRPHTGEPSLRDGRHHVEVHGQAGVSEPARGRSAGVHRDEGPYKGVSGDDYAQLRARRRP